LSSSPEPSLLTAPRRGRLTHPARNLQQHNLPYCQSQLTASSTVSRHTSQS